MCALNALFLNPFWPNDDSHALLKDWEIVDFLTFSGRIEMKHWPERGECGAMTMFSQHSHWIKNQSKGYYIVKCEKKKKKITTYCWYRKAVYHCYIITGHKLEFFTKDCFCNCKQIYRIMSSVYSEHEQNLSPYTFPISSNISNNITDFLFYKL